MTEIVFSYSRPSLAELGSRQSSIIEETRQNAGDTCKAGLHIDGPPSSPFGNTPRKAWSGLHAKIPADDLHLGGNADACRIPDAGKPAARPGAKKALAETWGAEDKDHTQAA